MSFAAAFRPATSFLKPVALLLVVLALAAAGVNHARVREAA